jgi:hypothetical protein
MVVNIIACLQGAVGFGQPDGMCMFFKKDYTGRYKCEQGNRLVEDVSKSVLSDDPDVGGRIICQDKRTI